VKRVAVEAASPLGWHEWVGTDGAVVAMHGFGASAPYKTLLEKFGFSAQNIAKVARGLL
jgi:transketolase